MNLLTKPQITFNEWRKSYDPYSNFNGKPFIEVPEPLLEMVYEVIDKHFKGRFIGANEVDFFNYFTNALTFEEFNFFSKLMRTYGSNKEYIDNILSGLYFVKTNGYGDSNASSRGVTDTTFTQDSLTDTDGKGRNLMSATPNSNIESNLSTDVSVPIKWEFATNITDTFNTSNSTANTNGTNNSTSTANSQNAFRNHYDKVGNRWGTKGLQELFEFLTKYKCFDELLKTLEKNFLYHMNGLEKFY